MCLAREHGHMYMYLTHMNIPTCRGRFAAAFVHVNMRGRSAAAFVHVNMRGRSAAASYM